MGDLLDQSKCQNIKITLFKNRWGMHRIDAKYQIAEGL